MDTAKAVIDRLSDLGVFSVSFGSIFDLGFYNWIHNDKLNEFRKMRKDKSCTHCEYGELCNGGCRLLYNKNKKSLIGRRSSSFVPSK